MAETPTTSDTPQRDMRLAALRVSIVTSILFLVLYGSAAWITQMRYDADPGSIGTWYYSWERFIPFVPVMIVPYMSIDLFFVVAPFLCRDRKELGILARRLSAVVILASLAFLIYPLRLAVERPEASGVFGSIYNGFVAMDRPFNLCPSMHIALRTVLAVHYGQYLSGKAWGLLPRVLMNAWFFLIGCSTLLLYQHHVIDVVGGFILATAVMYVFDGLPWRLPVRGGKKFAAGYAFVAAMLVWTMAIDLRWGWLVLWPATACLLVAIGYAGVGPAVYRRSHGQMSWPAKLLLGPVIAAQWLSWKYYGRQANRFDEVADGVFIGRHLTSEEGSNLRADGIHNVVDVCNAFDEPESIRSLQYLEVPILDLTAPTSEQLDLTTRFIEQNRHDGVLVHCKAGYSRSVAIVAAWLVRTGRAESRERAFEMIRRQRSQVVIRPEIRTLDLG